MISLKLDIVMEGVSVLATEYSVAYIHAYLFQVNKLNDN